MIESTRAPDVEATETLEEVVRRRADLYEAILSLERAAARPALEREEEWRTDLLEALDELIAQIADHIDVTERPDGLYAEIVTAAPRLSGRVHRLRDEHPEMQAATAALRERVEEDDPLDVDEIRDETRHLLGRLVTHRQHGADLLWQAYSLDTGGAE